MAFEDVALIYLAASLGAVVVAYVVSEVSNMLTTNRAINSIQNTTSMGINAVIAQHTSSVVSTHSLSTQDNTPLPAQATASATSSTPKS